MLSGAEEEGSESTVRTPTFVGLSMPLQPNAMLIDGKFVTRGVGH